ncbi:MAG: hypothetical protein ACXVH3_34775 [Solirubrobacteraceae bacterium]
MRRTVPPSAEIRAEIDTLLGRGLVDDPQKMLGELGRLGARLIIQRSVEEEFDTFWGPGPLRAPAGAGAWLAQLRLGVAQRVSPAARADGRG